MITPAFLNLCAAGRVPATPAKSFIAWAWEQAGYGRPRDDDLTRDVYITFAPGAYNHPAWIMLTVEGSPVRATLMVDPHFQEATLIVGAKRMRCERIRGCGVLHKRWMFVIGLLKQILPAGTYCDNLDLGPAPLGATGRYEL